MRRTIKTSVNLFKYLHWKPSKLSYVAPVEVTFRNPNNAKLFFFELQYSAPPPPIWILLQNQNKFLHSYYVFKMLSRLKQKKSTVFLICVCQLKSSSRTCFLIFQISVLPDAYKFKLFQKANIITEKKMFTGGKHIYVLYFRFALIQ